jgi:cytochrome c oxidase subunit 1
MPVPGRTASDPHHAKGAMFARMLRTTDPKMIGWMYLVTSLAFFALDGVMALLMRIELARPGRQFLS